MWIAGVNGARPGIAMKREPELGGPSYSQGWSPELPLTDRARVGQVGVTNCVPAGCYDDMIVTGEFNREEPGLFHLKYYAPAVGNTRVATTGPDSTGESVELVSVVSLTPAALADTRASVLELERGAYARSADVYGTTPPAG